MQVAFICKIQLRQATFSMSERQGQSYVSMKFHLQDSGLRFGDSELCHDNRLSSARSHERGIDVDWRASPRSH